VAHDHEWIASIASRRPSRSSKGTGCPYCAGQKVSKSNSLFAMRPDIAIQWHPTKNGNKTPHHFTTGSGFLAWWICPQSSDHVWQAKIARRTNGQGCSCCSGKRVVNSNCLTTSHPKIAAEWHPTKNGSNLPTQYTRGSHFKAWWKCSLHHEWVSVITNRTNNKANCPQCAIIQQSTSNSATWKGYKGLPMNYWSIICRNAASRGIAVTTTIEFIWDLFCKQNKRCALTGYELQMPHTKQKRSCGNASLDRIDSTRGYSNDNVQWVHKDIQMMKHVFSQQYFIETCRDIVKYHS
jgi:hypothetical protein